MKRKTVGGRVFPRGARGTWWIAYFRDGREFRESTRKLNPKNEPEIAERILDKRILEAQQPVFVPPKERKRRVSELLDALAADLKRRGKLSVGTESLIKIVRTRFDDMQTGAVNDLNLGAFI